MARRPQLSEEERRSLLHSLTEVGPSKPVGYLPLHAIRRFVQLTPEAVAATAKARGLAVAQFSSKQCCIKSGVLYVYHRQTLAQLLQARAAASCAAGLPLDPDRFVAHIASVWFGEGHPAKPIIAIAFGDRS